MSIGTWTVEFWRFTAWLYVGSYTKAGSSSGSTVLPKILSTSYKCNMYDRYSTKIALVTLRSFALVSAPKVMRCIQCSLVQSAIIPLMKCKSGNLSDVNNYRVIAISTAMSRLLESVIANHVFFSTETENYQFGFKAEHSTGICSSIFKQTVDYNVNHSSHV